MNGRKFLIINIFGIGDVLFTTPIIHNIRNAYPDAYIGYVCNRRACSVLENNPKVNRIFIYEKDDYRAIYKISKIRFLRKALESLREIKEEKFDIVIDLSLNKYASFFTWFLGIKRRIGLNYKNRSPLLNTKIELKGFEDKHVVEYYLSTLEPVGIPVSCRDLELFIQEGEREWVERFLSRENIKTNDLLIGFLPGGGASWGSDAHYRRWSVENYAKLANKIIENFNATIILMGDEKEKNLCERMSQMMRRRPVQACGQTSIPQLAALSRRCHFVIVNDGGPLHVAVAAGAKTISIFGPVDETIYGPYPPDQHVVVTRDIACRPCYRRFHRADCDHVSCLNLLTADDVFAEVRRLLEPEHKRG
ncbi:MAG: glycosyltransferase family 9 protein [Candidatus Omnitrophota bacterium]